MYLQITILDVNLSSESIRFRNYYFYKILLLRNKYFNYGIEKIWMCYVIRYGGTWYVLEIARHILCKNSAV